MARSLLPRQTAKIAYDVIEYSHDLLSTYTLNFHPFASVLEVIN